MLGGSSPLLALYPGGRRLASEPDPAGGKSCANFSGVNFSPGIIPALVVGLADDEEEGMWCLKLVKDGERQEGNFLAALDSDFVLNQSMLSQ